MFTQPDRVSFSVNLIERTRWVKRMMITGLNGAEILGVQTLRNLSMGASFLASAIIITAVALLNSLLAESNTPINVSTSGERSTAMTSEITLYWEIRMASLVVCLFFAFLCFASCIRTSTHASFLISLRLPTAAEMEEEDMLVEDDRNLSIGPEFLHKALNHHIHRTSSHSHVVQTTASLLGRSTLGFFLGIRLMYLVVPLAGWLVNSYGLLVGTFTALGFFVLGDFY